MCSYHMVVSKSAFQWTCICNQVATIELFSAAAGEDNQFVSELCAELEDVLKLDVYLDQQILYPGHVTFEVQKQCHRVIGMCPNVLTTHCRCLGYSAHVVIASDARRTCWSAFDWLT